MDLYEVQQQEEDGLAGVLAATEGALADPEARNGNRAQPRTEAPCRTPTRRLGLHFSG